MSDNKAGFPWYFAIDDRLVKVVATPDGGMDVLVLDPSTGQLEQNLAYLAQCFEPGRAVERLTEAEFTTRIQQQTSEGEN
ncbi:MAG TPA: hypothetical protein IGS53_17665 [Leptolyngbyaceae cyanobacterium M33_DOE_097]|uniref:Uncharacterized protein n=1 Tax=Oscillatoriales cyanobacterium SpSt-418 TaxID=2282169 RepID=A0A7C3KHB2_9CYAN|nr:hypothetical protein [Leptolyngbyaceae cyanobacterium M33_DOE_097]